MEIPQKVWEVINGEISSTDHGSVALIVQDGHLIQIDKTEKIRLTPGQKGKLRTKTTAPDESMNSDLRLKLSKMLDGLQYGQIIIVVRDNAVTQIERLKKYRANDWEGMFGEGI